ncbi:hypothetical protein Val02_45560 [Virgisporangium aliadipatigenens]|uniref:NodB homology domain-containing protein n=1 Tax=Virgisporangium aliadipatigenens TaxID=741659 RepID=A0A8J3YPJ4_9ACTN|nr:hypothetical protein [Virgisporangium aliadipatigenens]GIJ47670.1 hypothetical protein Val02_45560 [Virgisporangium aliadipatigenens]
MITGRVRALVALAVLATFIWGNVASAAEATKKVNLRVLVVSDGTAGVDAVAAQLDREGIPYDVRRPGEQPLTAASLIVGTDHGRYQGIVLPDESVLTAAEKTALAAYEKSYGVRRVNAYTWAGPHVGLTSAWGGTLDGGTMTVTAAAKADGFGYLNGTVPVDDRSAGVSESFAALGAPANGAAFTPLVEATQPGGTARGTVLGVYKVDGREQLAVTVALNRHQTHALLLAHGIVSWLTRGVHLGHWRNWFSLHVDDVFLPDDRWSTEANCTVGDDCPAGVTGRGDIRMTPSDVDTLANWQQRNGLKLDLAFNGAGSEEAGAGDPLTAKLLQRRGDFRWLNHTWSHLYIGPTVARADIAAEVTRNTQWARTKGLPLDPAELVTGEHSGLRSLPRMPADNPNLAGALADSGVAHLASDASREPAPRAIGPARTVPRHPMNIYYNTATVAEAVDEYNWIYTSTVDGGSGVCATNPASTCIAPLGANGFTGHIVPQEARIAFDHVVSADPRPHYAHQSNLTEDRILYPVLDELLRRYRAAFTTATPLVNPRMSAVAQLQLRQERWRAAVAAGSITAYRQGDTVVVTNRSGSTVDVPLTGRSAARTATLGLLPGGAYGEAYGGQRSAWTSLARNATLTVKP